MIVELTQWIMSKRIVKAKNMAITRKMSKNKLNFPPNSKNKTISKKKNELSKDSLQSLLSLCRPLSVRLSIWKPERKNNGEYLYFNNFNRLL